MGLPFGFQCELCERLRGSLLQRWYAQSALVLRAGLGYPHPSRWPRFLGQAQPTGHAAAALVA